MCGIVGILARKTQIPPAVLEQATRSLAHRGPDDSGTVLLKETQPEPLEIGLGHRRLAILDLSPLGHQPMQDPVTGNWIVFNGEIYNFRELREGTRSRRRRVQESFRHGSDSGRLSRVGRVLPDAAGRHVRVCPLGRAAQAAAAGARSHGNQAAVLPPVEADFYFCFGGPNAFADGTRAAKGRSHRSFELPGVRFRV